MAKKKDAGSSFIKAGKRKTIKKKPGTNAKAKTSRSGNGKKY